MSDLSILGNYSVGVYKSKDPISNFKIKVTLVKSTGGTIKDLIDNDDAQEGLELRKLEKKMMRDVSQSSKEEKIFEWQKKIFSKREFSKFGDENFTPNNNLEEYYKDDCLKLKQKGYQAGRLFTYIDSDPFEHYEEIDDFADLSGQIPPYLAKNKSYIRKRRPLLGKSKAIEELPRINIINYSLNSDENKASSTQYHKMTIMADISSNASGMLPGECVLCSMKVDSSGTIIIKPDFNSNSKPYVIGSGIYGNDTFEYIIENVSTQISQEDLFRELKLQNELYARHVNFVKNLVGSDFYIPEPRVLNVHVFGEIVCARNFDYDDLHVYYQLDLPNNWFIDQSQSMCGFTATSRSTCQETDEVAYFSHPFEFTLSYKNNEIDPDKRDELPKMPKIYFEVASYDSWSRYRVEGYSWLQISTKPGKNYEKLSCWRPRGDSFIYELRRFFIGGSPELEDISYAAVPSNHENSILSKFGFRTVTTGQLEIKMNTVFQSTVFMDEKMKIYRKFQLLDKIGNSSKINDVMSVLSKYRSQCFIQVEVF